MEKYLVTIEFRYSDAPDRFDSTTRNKEITIGVFDAIDEAYTKGNEALTKLEGRFNLNPHYNKKERFSKNGGAFGSNKHLITNLRYLKTPFQFFAKITTLKFDSVESSIDDVLDSVKRYRDFKSADVE